MLIGRKKQQAELLEAYNSDDSRFVALYGRRRVGKTYLIKQTFKDKFTFSHSGLANGSLQEQLYGWRSSLENAGYVAPSTPKHWLEAFDILLIICGSATSWIINKIFRNHGGLHNRVNYQIFLEPFTLHECEEYSEAMGLAYSRYDLLEAYMVMGGVPYYWSLMQKGRSLAQNIDSLFFAPQGLLHYEFRELYDSLFRNSDKYIDVVSILGKKLGGMRREEIVSGLGIADNGNLSRILEDLEHCGFIVRTNAYGARKYNAIYRLMDNFSLFFLKFMQENKTDDPSFWSHNYTSPLRYSWCGLAFERVCFQHIPQIKQALGISGVVTNTYSWLVKDDPVYGAGAQIDMLIERADNTVNICEMKFSQNEFVIDKDYDAVLRHKLSRFGASVSHRKAIHLTMVTTYGVVHNAYWNRVQSEVVADDLFCE